MKMLILVCCFLYILNTIDAVSFTDSLDEECELFKTQFSKKYVSESEETFRFFVFMDNKHKIASHNIRFHKGEESYELKMNQFGDLLNTEFTEKMNGFKPNKNLRKVMSRQRQGTSVSFIAPFNVTVPDTVDWRNQGAVTKVKNQGQCASCWAFSATGSLEGQHFRSTGELVSLSEQNLIDCSGEFGNHGCNGGFADSAFAYVEFNKGIDTEESYPYEARDNTCRYKASNSGATDKGFVDIRPSGSEDNLKLAVATIGPVSVAIDASRQTFQFYGRGVYYEKDCSSDLRDLDHAVLVVGYGTENGNDYWLVKNSWGRNWGLDGYIKMARNKSNNCGIATAASYPLV